MVERKIELAVAGRGRKKMTKLKKKLTLAKDQREHDAILAKIHIHSPWWAEPAKA